MKAPAHHTPTRRPASIAEAAEHIGTSERTVRRYIADGRLTGYRVGPRLIRVDLDELDNLLRPIPTASTADRIAAGRDAR